MKNKAIEVRGLTEAFFSSVKRFLNCSYSYHLPAALTFGTPGPNGTWKSGLMADLVNNVVDITLPAVARAADRDAIANPTSPILNLPVGILAGRNRTQDTNVAGYLLTFDLQVWLLLLFFLAILSIILGFLDVTSLRMRSKRALFLETWNEHFWMLFENMFCEASAQMPQKTVLRIVSAVWWLAIVVLMNAFAGQMRACLMVKNELERVNTLHDIAARPHLKVYLLKNTVATRYLESSKGAAEQKIWSMIRRDKTDLFGLLRFPEEMLLEVVQEKAVVIHVHMVSQTEVGKFCSAGQTGEFYFGAEKMYNLLFGAYMNRRLNETLQHRIKRMMTAVQEGGIVLREYVVSVPPMDRCRIAEQAEDLKLSDMASVFYLYAFFSAASILIFLGELIAGRLTRCTARSKRPRPIRRRLTMRSAFN